MKVSRTRANGPDKVLLQGEIQVWYSLCWTECSHAYCLSIGKSILKMGS
jgi:hypothetical protein